VLRNSISISVNCASNPWLLSNRASDAGTRAATSRDRIVKRITPRFDAAEHSCT